MELRKRILSHFLLVTYLLVVLHHSVSDSQTLVFGETALHEPSHKHEDFKTVHHNHHFHVGIFHFIGHLFEYINLSNDPTDDHLIVVQNSTTKKVVVYNNPVNIYFDGNSLMLFEVDAESLPDPPFYLSFLQKFKHPNTPLRAPPASV